MMGAVGLRTHIWNNNLKSILLLAGFPFLLMLLAFAAALVLTGMGGDTYSSGQGGMDLGADFSAAIDIWPTMALWSIIIAGIWFVIAWFGHQTMIDMATGAHSVTRQEEPELYNLLENLCISRGITMPKLKVIETDVLNAYASGLTDKQYTVTVTRGLMAKLNKAELEAVLAHELSHILNRDVRLLVVSVIFVGIFSFVAQIVFRSLFWGGLGGRSSGRRGNAALLMIIAIAIVAVAYFLAIAIRFALSRKREYMADAGAVELTRNPDAVISALEKISGHAEMDNTPDGVREMMIENPKAGFAGVFATHPPIEKRIEALVEFAGGQRRVRSTSVPAV
ncbi:M48 family metallopeptidase [Hyphobacterium sp.]|uniref:M48 family metallopeptidase n=1 Tax=Hyphobacterium sp. TaxID=2004662 RepID=UPI00374A0550